MSKDNFRADMFTLCVNFCAEVLSNNILRICKSKPEILKDIEPIILQSWALYGGVPACWLSFENSEHIRAVMEEIKRRQLMEPIKRGTKPKRAQAIAYLLEGMEKLRKKFED